MPSTPVYAQVLCICHANRARWMRFWCTFRLKRFVTLVSQVAIHYALSVRSGYTLPVLVAQYGPRGLRRSAVWASLQTYGHSVAAALLIVLWLVCAGWSAHTSHKCLLSMLAGRSALGSVVLLSAICSLSSAGPIDRVAALAGAVHGDGYVLSALLTPVVSQSVSVDRLRLPADCPPTARPMKLSLTPRKRSNASLNSGPAAAKRPRGRKNKDKQVSSCRVLDAKAGGHRRLAPSTPRLRRPSTPCSVYPAATARRDAASSTQRQAAINASLRLPRGHGASGCRVLDVKAGGHRHLAPSTPVGGMPRPRRKPRLPTRRQTSSGALFSPIAAAAAASYAAARDLRRPVLLFRGHGLLTRHRSIPRLRARMHARSTGGSYPDHAFPFGAAPTSSNAGQIGNLLVDTLAGCLAHSASSLHTSESYVYFPWSLPAPLVSGSRLMGMPPVQCAIALVGHGLFSRPRHFSRRLTHYLYVSTGAGVVAATRRLSLPNFFLFPLLGIVRYRSPTRRWGMHATVARKFSCHMDETMLAIRRCPHFVACSATVLTRRRPHAPHACRTNEMGPRPTIVFAAPSTCSALTGPPALSLPLAYHYEVRGAGCQGDDVRICDTHQTIPQVAPALSGPAVPDVCVAATFRCPIRMTFTPCDARGSLLMAPDARFQQCPMFDCLCHALLFAFRGPALLWVLAACIAAASCRPNEPLFASHGPALAITSTER
ncbi:hypothetical protein GGX14DRAFT_558323 [Mycena pura]|uniref:Uncharacterized protein n=1 Tax=Mycena pura TaxID=153505 RepID=A0AAD6VU58_9AGAR|nr:hypothetical protein GGX14DRAFT_558323 [Mycena pura]